MPIHCETFNLMSISNETEILNFPGIKVLDKVYIVGNWP